MAPSVRRQELKEVDHSNLKPRVASVLMLFYPREAQTYFALIRRAQSKGKHSGQIALPGGRQETLDEGKNAQTALRETEEEIGVPRSEMELIRETTSLYIPPSNFRVYPFLAFAKATPSFTPQISEVKEILEVPLRQLMDDSCLTETRLSTSYAQNLHVPAYLLNDEIVWGATAMMLSEIRSILKDAG